MDDFHFLVGKSVAEIRDGSRIVFVPGSRPEPDLYADVGFAELVDGGGATIPLTALVGRTVSAASAPSGSLRLAFTDGSVLRCDPDPQYEAWQVAGGDPQALIVCEPGGELAIWDKRHIVTRAEAEESVERLNAALGWNVQLKDVHGSSFTVEPAE
jgi:hypothetical protein